MDLLPKDITTPQTLHFNSTTAQIVESCTLKYALLCNGRVFLAVFPENISPDFTMSV